MASAKLRELIALKRQAPYSPSQSIAFLRGPGPDGGRVARPDTEVTPVDAGGVPCEWVTYSQPRHPFVFIYLHGGGYYRSSAIASRRIASDLSHACGCRCLTVEYRLAPEHPFPAGIEDAHTVYRWLLKQGISPGQIVVSGCSAGGGLTAALLLKLKQTGESHPGAAVLLSPWTDLTQRAATFTTNAHSDPVISKEYLDRMAGYYLNGVDPQDPLASPVYSDLSGFPPTLIQAGKPETMFGDAVAFAEKAKQSGVNVEFQPFDDVIHGWQDNAWVIPDIPEALTALNKIGEFVRAHCR